MSKNIEASIKKITDKGYSKSKAQKALKDCNNNVQQALKLLENQSAQADRAQKAEELLRQKEYERQEKEALRAFRRAQGLPEDSDEERELLAAETRKMKLHPCIQQYGSCKFGKFCHFKYLPGDTCINYLLGNCIYDIKCLNRHSYEGEDLRKYVKDMQNEALVYEDESGAYYGVNPQAKGKVVAADFAGGGYNEGEEWAAPAPLPSAFDTTDGAEPTYTEPALADTIWENDYVEEAPAPQPFLEKLKRGLDAKVAAQSSLKANSSSWVPLSQKPAPKVTVVGSGGAEPSRGILCAKTRFASASKAKHPCIYQMGSCKFGDACAHKNEPADVCVFFLNGKCRLPEEECEYRHVRSGKGAADDFTEEELMFIHGRPVGGAGSRISALISHSNNVWGTTSLAAPSADPAHIDIEDETEEMAFYFLKDAFPHKNDMDILQALRLGGSRDAAVDLLFEFESMDLQDAARIERKLQEEEAMEEIAQSELTERLITLCQLFPSMEVAGIENALDAADGDFDNAFRDLQCRVENVVRTDRHNKWGRSKIEPTSAFALKGSAPTAADRLKLDRLYAMFSDLPKEVVEDVFAECGTVPLSIDTLRLLVHDLSTISDADREEAGRLQTRSSAPIAKPAPSAGGGSSFSVRAGGHESIVQAGPFISNSDVYAQIVASVDGTEDWRRLRQEAAMINRARIQCISLAGHAYSTGNGKGAQAMGSRARQLGILYEKTNILAMHALEAEGKRTGINVLDLHGFRKDEALDVLKRRLELCVRRKCRKLRVIMGRGLHSENGKAVLFPLVVEHIRGVSPFCEMGSIFSLSQSHVDVDVHV